MKSNEVLRRVFEQCGFKKAADKLRLALSCLYKWCEPDGGRASGALNPLERLWELIQATGDLRPLHWLNEKCGGFFTKNPKTGKPKATLLESSSGVRMELGELERLMASTEADGKVTPEEAKSLRGQWEQVKMAMETHVYACERKFYHGLALFLPLLSSLMPEAAPMMVEG